MNDKDVYYSHAVAMQCPACGREVEARLAWNMLTVLPVLPHAAVPVEVPATATLVGLAMAHDCLPKATR